MRIDTVTPRGGSVGTPVVVLGNDFGLVAGRIVFDPLSTGVLATPTVWINDRIEFLVPAGLLRDRFLTLLVERDGATDAAYVPFWVPKDVTDPLGLDYQYPQFDAGVELDDAGIDNPRLTQAADFNRLLSLALAAVGDMTRAVYDTNSNGIVDNTEAIDDAGTPRTWADIVALVTSGVKVSSNNKNMQGLVTVADGDKATNTTVAETPAFGGHVAVDVNGVSYVVGNGTKVGVDCYFSGDNGVTARTMANIAAGDTLHWNGSVVCFQLSATDFIDFVYLVLA